jgi:hypothetical protein
VTTWEIGADLVSHCIVPVGPDRYAIRDCGSLNSTRINDERITGIHLYQVLTAYSLNDVMSAGIVPMDGQISQ